MPAMNYYLSQYSPTPRIVFCLNYLVALTQFGDLLFLFRFLLILLLLLHHPDCCRVIYCYSTFLFHYYYSYYITLSVVGWCIAVLRFLFTIIIIIIIIIIMLIILLPHIFVRSISRRCLDQTLWNLVGISFAMWSWFFRNGCHCHGNGQNANKLKNTKMIIAGYSPNRNWWNLIGTTSTASRTR